jgi:hypothetical protein
MENTVFVWLRSSHRIYRRGIPTLALVLVSLPFTIHIWKGWWDAYSAYSGIVVEKGVEFRLLGWSHFNEFLILKDSQGKSSKKYISDYGYAFAHVGTFVIKKKGFGEYPRQPGEKTPRELFQQMEKIKAEKAKNNRPSD